MILKRDRPFQNRAVFCIFRITSCISVVYHKRAETHNFWYMLLIFLSLSSKLQNHTIMKKETIVIMLLCFTLQGNAQETAMCTYDASGNRLSRFIYVDRSRSLQRMTDKGGHVEMANERFGNLTNTCNSFLLARMR